jgi:hypothetical protein
MPTVLYVTQPSSMLLRCKAAQVLLCLTFQSALWHNVLQYATLLQLLHLRSWACVKHAAHFPRINVQFTPLFLPPFSSPGT